MVLNPLLMVLVIECVSIQGPTVKQCLFLVKYITITISNAVKSNFSLVLLHLYECKPIKLLQERGKPMYNIRASLLLQGSFYFICILPRVYNG